MTWIIQTLQQFTTIASLSLGPRHNTEALMNSSLPERRTPSANPRSAICAPEGAHFHRNQADEDDHRRVRRWLGLSGGALITAGLFSLGLIIGRMPPFSEWVTDPQFFKRALVVHVDLALIVWFYAFITGLFCLIPRRKRARKIASHAAPLSAAGV